MSTKIKYTDESIEAKVIQDFLPPPEELAFREGDGKFTIVEYKQKEKFYAATD